MERVYLETIETINGKFSINEIGDAVFWEVSHPNDPKGYLFHSLKAAQDYISDTEITPSWDGLFELYVSKNLAVN